MLSDSNIKLVKQKGTEDGITRRHSTHFINKKNVEKAVGQQGTTQKPKNFKHSDSEFHITKIKICDASFYNSELHFTRFY